MNKVQNTINDIHIKIMKFNLNLRGALMISVQHRQSIECYFCKYLKIMQVKLSPKPSINFSGKSRKETDSSTCIFSVKTCQYFKFILS